MMCSSKSLLAVALMAVLLLQFCSKSEASNFDCCLRYTEKRLPSKIIMGFTQQLANEACDINAIIFYTKKRFLVCADPKKQWVRQVVQILSKRVRKM